MEAHIDQRSKGSFLKVLLNFPPGKNSDLLRLGERYPQGRLWPKTLVYWWVRASTASSAARSAPR